MHGFLVPQKKFFFECTISSFLNEPLLAAGLPTSRRQDKSILRQPYSSCRLSTCQWANPSTMKRKHCFRDLREPKRSCKVWSRSPSHPGRTRMLVQTTTAILLLKRPPAAKIIWKGTLIVQVISQLPKGCVPIWRVGIQAQSIATGGNLYLFLFLFDGWSLRNLDIFTAFNGDVHIETMKYII